MGDKQNNNKPTGYICIPVGNEYTCRFNGACYGYICIAPDICSKTDKTLTADDKKMIKEFKERDK